MKKRIFSIFLMLVLLCSLGVSAYAEHLTGASGWKVTYTTKGTMDSNFRTKDYNDPVKGLQPGDDITFTVTLKNENSADTDWYMTNEVLHSLEDRSKDTATAGGAYTYTLIYTSPKGTTRTLYDSDTVGGENVSAAGEGLHEATSALKDYFYLDTLKANETATVTLTVALDGETQGNDYQDTLADLQMNFAVEAKGSSTRANVVKTGDEMRLFPLYVVMVLSGLLFLYLAIDSLRQRRKEAGR